MNDYLLAIVIGVVEGLTEFLPVSSTAHIRFTQLLLGQDVSSEYWKMFAVVIQLGAILAVVVYFRERLLSLLSSLPRTLTPISPWLKHPLMLVLISFVVTAVPCFLMDEIIGEYLESLWVMGWALLVGGIAMWAIDVVCSKRGHTDSIQSMSLLQAISVGLFQILAAMFPGTSRSMSTIAGGQLMGMTRPAALEFSFFLSIPVMIAATGFKLLQYVVGDESNLSEPMNLERWSILGVGFVTSFITAWIVIAWFMQWVKKHGFVPFAIYRIVAGIYVLIWVLQTGVK